MEELLKETKQANKLKIMLLSGILVVLSITSLYVGVKVHKVTKGLEQISGVIQNKLEEIDTDKINKSIESIDGVVNDLNSITEDLDAFTDKVTNFNLGNIFNSSPSTTSDNIENNMEENRYTNNESDIITDILKEIF